VDQQWSETDRVWVRDSNCGYQGPAEIVGWVFANTWLVKSLRGEEKVFTVKSEFLTEWQDPEPDAAPKLSKEEKKELRRKLKAERKSHQPRSDSRRR